MASICGRRRSKSGADSCPAGGSHCALMVGKRFSRRISASSHTVSTRSTNWLTGTYLPALALKTWALPRSSTPPRSSAGARARMGIRRSLSRYTPICWPT